MRTALVLVLFWGVACRDQGGVFRDASIDSGADDAGVVLDAAVTDAQPSDLGSAVDSGSLDTGVLVDGGSPTDGGSGMAPGPGDLVFVEIQGNPQDTADNQAEYFELINVSGRALDLLGCRLTHRQWAGGTAPVDSVGNHRIAQSVSVAAGARVLLTRSGGGYFGAANPDYVYDGFELSNGGSDNNRIRLMAPGWAGDEPPNAADVIDEVIMPAATFDNPLRGRAWQVDPAQVPNPSASANDAPNVWCHAAANAPLAYWSNNWGTPGAPNVCN